MKNLTLVMLLFVLGACSKKIAHSSMNSLDWAGTYVGVIPDKGGAEVQSKLSLKEDLTYELAQGNAKTNGDFVWKPNGGEVTLFDGRVQRHFFVGENFIKEVNKKGKDIKEGKYVLSKSNNDLSIVEKYWKLIEINGQPVKVTEGQTEPHLILKKDDARVIGNGGCNSFNGTYELDVEKGRIKFSKMMSTLRACPDMKTEDAFNKVFGQVDNFTTDGEYLSLNKARMAPMARFKVVYLR